jgi:hypothetical protein
VPRRSNLFQDVVAIVHRQLASDAHVEECAMLPHRVTGDLREIDVLIRGNIAGQELLVGIEASALSRKVDIRWVEQLISKHEELPTDKLILVSDLGFTKQAQRLAEAKGVICVAPEDILKDGDGQAVLKAGSLKFFTLTPTLWQFDLVLDDGSPYHFDSEPTPELWLVFDNGEEWCCVQVAVAELLSIEKRSLLRSDKLSTVGVDTTTTFTVTYNAATQIVDDSERFLCLRIPINNSLTDFLVTRLTIKGDIALEVQEMPLWHRRISNIATSFGEFAVDGLRISLVTTTHDGEKNLTVRVREEGSTAFVEVNSAGTITRSG